MNHHFPLTIAAATLSLCSLTITTAALAADLPIDVGAGLIGVLNGNFLDKPDETHPSYQGHPISFETYPGFAGMGYGGGIMLDARAFDTVGLELDFLRSKDTGHGDHTVNGRKFTVTVGQSAWHMPVYIKVNAPMPMVRPMLFVGPEFVFPSSADASVSPDNLGYPPVNAHVDSYLMWSGGLGVEIKLPVPAMDIRIPFSLRASYNPSVTDNLDDRSETAMTPVGTGVKIDKISYNTEWKYQAQIALGAAIYF